MTYDQAGEYEVMVEATDECGNETRETRSILVAKEIRAGDNITVEQDGNVVTVSADVCGALDECQTIIDMQDDIDGKQDELTAGNNITIENNVISSSGETYTAGDNIEISAENVISADLTDYYNKTEVDELIDAIETGEFVIVQTLPATGESKTVYLVPKQGGGYSEYVYINNAWEEIGDTDIDLSDYYTKAETDALIEDFLTCEDLSDCQTISDMQDEIDGKQDALTAGANIQIAQDGTISATDTTYQNATQSTAGLMSAADKTKLDGMTPSDYLTCANVLNCQSVSDAFDAKQDELTAGSNIQIAQDGTISATDTTYTAGSNITITNGEISATFTKAELLTIMGYEEIELSITDKNDDSITAMVLGYIAE